MNLYQIEREILSLVDMETGEILDVEALNALQMERDKKIENVALWAKNLDAEAEAIRAEEKALAERRAAKERKAESLRKYLADTLAGETFESAKVKLSWRSSSKVEVTDSNALLAWIEKEARYELLKAQKPDFLKTEIGKLLKAGVDVPGATQTTQSNLQMK